MKYSKLSNGLFELTVNNITVLCSESDLHRVAWGLLSL